MSESAERSRADVERIRRVRVVLWTILGLNLAVAVAKVVWGTATGSVSMQADGFHSTFDGLSNVVGLIGMSLAARPADADHPYGHPKYETYASAVIGAMLLLAAWRVGSEAIGRLMHPSVPEVNWISFSIMIGTLAVNLLVTTWERREGERLRSDLLIADASHTGSDILVSCGVILGLVAVSLGYPIADPIIALLVTAAIAYAAYNVFSQVNETLSDQARIPGKEVAAVALTVPGVLDAHDVRTRGTDAQVFVDLHVQVDPKLTVEQGHEIAEQVERTLVEQFDQVRDVVAHIEPMDGHETPTREPPIARSDAAPDREAGPDGAAEPGSTGDGGSSA